MKNKAFTLIEMMVVVGIIIFLSSIVGSRYIKYFSKAKQAEASLILSSLHTAQQVYWSENGEYSSNLNEIGWEPEGYNGGGKKAKFNYTYGFFFPGAEEGVHFFTGKLETPAKELEGSFTDKDSFVAKAAGHIYKKTQVDVWSIDTSRSIKHEINGI